MAGQHIPIGTVQRDNFNVHGDLRFATDLVREVSWPVRVGLLPAVADQYQDRGFDLDAEHEEAGNSSVTLVSSGLGGTGKTQLAASYAHALWERRDLDVLVWITAASRDAVITGYAATAHEVGLDLRDRDSEQASSVLLMWLERTERRWLIVLDDLADPRHLDQLWPTGKAGRVLVTTRRTDAALRQHGRILVNVDVFTPEQAVDYLYRKLVPAQANDIEGLAEDLGRLPLALAQAAAYISDHPSLTAQSYRSRLADRRRTLATLLPPEAAADEYRSTVAATWSLSVEAANSLDPHGAARRVLALTGWLAANGIPSAVFHTTAVASYLFDNEPGTDQSVGFDDVDDAISNLARFSLVDHVRSESANGIAIRVHALVQRTARDNLDTVQKGVAVASAAEALLEAWPADDHHFENAEVVAAFRANTDALRASAGELLWSPKAHDVLFRAGHSLAGLPYQAVSYWEELVATTGRALGSDHPDTLMTRNNLAAAYRIAGRIGDAILLLEATSAARGEVLGPDHPDTLTSRNNLANAYQAAGRTGEAIPLYETTLTARERALGPDHPDTLMTRNDLATAYQAAGQTGEAIQLYETTLTARERTLGPDHPDTLTSRGNLANAYRVLNVPVDDDDWDVHRQWSCRRSTRDSTGFDLGGRHRQCDGHRNRTTALPP